MMKILSMFEVGDLNSTPSLLSRVYLKYRKIIGDLYIFI